MHQVCIAYLTSLFLITGHDGLCQCYANARPCSNVGRSKRRVYAIHVNTGIIPNLVETSTVVECSLFTNSILERGSKRILGGRPEDRSLTFEQFNLPLKSVNATWVKV